MRSLLAASVALLAAACATSSPPAAPPAPPNPYALSSAGTIEMTSTGVPGQAVAVRAERMLGTVTSVNRAAPSVTLAMMGGATVAFTVGPELKLLDEVSAGDAVLVDVEQQLRLEFQDPGTESVPFTVSGNRAADAPNGIGASGVRATLTVAKVDLGTRIVTLTDPAGTTYAVKAGPGLRIEPLKTGDRFLATYAQAVAIRLEKAPAKP